MGVRAMTLLQMKEKVEEAKTEKAKLEGQIESIHSRLKNEYSLNSVEDAEKKVEALTSEVNEKENQLQQGISQLEDEYNWE